MSLKVFKSVAVASCVALVAAACGGSNGGGRSVPIKTVSATSSLGAIVGASCTIAPANNPANILDTGTTNTSGLVSWDVPESTGPVIVSCSGGSYYDEASNGFISLSGTIRAVAPSTATSVAITPLTDLAAIATERAGGVITDDLINNAAAAIGSYFGVTDILSPPQVVNDAADLSNLTGDNAGVYAAVLAGLSDIGATGGGNAESALTRLQADLQADDDLGDDITRNQIDGATNNRAAGTAAAAPAASNQARPNRNNGSIQPTGAG